MRAPNAYDDVPYRSYPIEWTAPERLALTSMLHAGPRPPRDDYRVLELGCGDGANLLALAYYRPYARFVGIDAAASRIALARSRQAELRLTNVEFVECDLRAAMPLLQGRFDYVIAHGVFSWIAPDARDALLALCAERVTPDGLSYLNYNTRPGWNIRAMVRDHLLAATTGASGLADRAAQAQALAARIVASLSAGPHPYGHLIANEFQFVVDGHRSYIAHEFLAEHNHAYWRSEFHALLRDWGLEIVADADFNHASGRIDPELPKRLEEAQIGGPCPEDTLDLLSYRQLHSPILARAGARRRPIEDAEAAGLTMASCLRPKPIDRAVSTFVHPSGYEVDARDARVDTALRRLYPLWPRGHTLAELFPDVEHVFDDLLLLYRNGLIDLRLEPTAQTPPPDPTLLNRLESAWGGYRTSPLHVCELHDVVD